jgi:non-heme chloroperoxidase
MLPVEPNLEVHSRLPGRGNGNGRKPPLLFVHGGYSDAWCWLPHFLPWFAARG